MAVSAPAMAIPISSRKAVYVYPSIRIATQTAWLTVSRFVEDVAESGFPRRFRVTWKAQPKAMRRRVRAGMAWADEHLGTNYLATVRCAVKGQCITLSLKASAPGLPLPHYVTGTRSARPGPTPPEVIARERNHFDSRYPAIKFVRCASCGYQHWHVVGWENWGEMGG